jgi:3-deoxy-7-phosphoheptulonate synthase
VAAVGRVHPGGGNNDVILCERGIRTFETATRNTFDISAIPVSRS